MSDVQRVDNDRLGAFDFTNYSLAQSFYPFASLPYWHGTTGEGHLMASGTVNCYANDVIRANVTFGASGVSPVPNARIVVTRSLF